MFDDSNKGLINWFHILLYQIPAEEFLEIIGNAISEDRDKIKKATNRFEEIMKEAQKLKSEFEDYKDENDIESDDEDDDEGLDDFLGSLGISRPK
jgi:Ran GTPase-activating protein (RanGAP) involved in mRNA processing and transport